MTEDRAHRAERDRGHDDQRLGVRAQRNREQHVDDPQRHQEAEAEARHRLGTLALLPLETERDARVRGQDLRERPQAEARHDLLGGDHLAVDVGGHRHDAPAVGAADRREAAPQLGPRHGGEGNLGAVGCADPHVLQVPERTALGLGVAEHHAHVVLAALNPLHLGAVEGGSHLTRQVVLRDAERLGLGEDLQPHLLLAGSERVRDVECALVVRKRRAQLRRRGDQLLRVVRAQLDRDRLARVDLERLVGDLHGVGDRSGELAPALGQLSAGRFALRGWSQLQQDLRQVGASTAHLRGSPRAAATQLLADGGEHVADDAVAGGPLGAELVAQLLSCTLQLSHRRLRVWERRALGQRDRGEDLVTLDPREELERDAAAGEEADGQDQHADGTGQRQVAPLDHALQRRLVVVSHEVLQPARHAVLDSRPASCTLRPLLGESVRQVRR